MKTVCVLGRQPALGLAELECLYGADAVLPYDRYAAVLSLPPDTVDFGQLGGSTRLAVVLTEIESADWKAVEKECIKQARATSFAVPTEGKFHLGLSAYGFAVSPEKLNAAALTLKKVIQAAHGVSVRVVPNREGTELSTAQVYHNHLADERGAELLIIKGTGNKTIIARTVAVQDINRYTLRDRGRPKRDARVGMLPPKLAQIIINLATGQIARHASQATNHEDAIILDPFCGTGVILQEALLMGYSAYGTDLEPRMVEYSRENLAWLVEKYQLQSANYILEPGDATTHNWQIEGRRRDADGDNKTPPFSPDCLPSTIYIACETYLGRPFTERPGREVLEQTVSEANTIIKKFLQNIKPQLTAGTRLCLAVPAWQTAPDTFRHVPLISSIESLGFERIQLIHAASNQLIYYRPQQTVARELLVLRRP